MRRDDEAVHTCGSSIIVTSAGGYIGNAKIGRRYGNSCRYVERAEKSFRHHDSRPLHRGIRVRLKLLIIVLVCLYIVAVYRDILKPVKQSARNKRIVIICALKRSPINSGEIRIRNSIHDTLKGSRKIVEIIVVRTLKIRVRIVRCLICAQKNGV